MKRFIALPLALACAVTGGCARPEEKEVGSAIPSVYSIAEASYPEMAAYPDETAFFGEDGIFDDEGFSQVYDAWRADKRARQEQYEGYEEGLDGFFAAGIREFLSRANGENRAYSPLNVYMALGMLAEVTDGESRAQLLELLGYEDIESLRRQADAVWNANYCNDGAVTSILGSSLWLNDKVSFVQETMDSLAANYHASSYRGEMGSEDFNKALQTWLNEQTGGQLKEQAEGVKMDAETILALASTIYYRAKWSSEFSESNTAEGLFHLPGADGESVSCDFMHKSGSNSYYWGDKFSAVPLRMEGSGAMWFVLPDEGVSVDELLADGQAMDFMLSGGTWENSKHLIVNMAVPKFDIASDIDLCAGLKNLGVTDVFDPNVSDFSPMTEDMEGIFLSQAKHAARVTIDEKGCTAAAYTVMMMAGSAMPPDEEVDFVLDRPFIFVLTSQDGLPLFTGVVNNPS